MGTKEIRERNRQVMHEAILQAALRIVREEGYESLSLRRLGASIEFSATVVYIYYLNKEALTIDLARLGYRFLNSEIKLKCEHITDPKKRLKAILTVYWNFAKSERQLFLLIHEVEKRLDELIPLNPELTVFTNCIDAAVREICNEEKYTEIYIKRKAFSSIALIQGLVLIDLTHKEVDITTKVEMLDDGINLLIKSMK